MSSSACKPPVGHYLHRRQRCNKNERISKSPEGLYPPDATHPLCEEYIHRLRRVDIYQTDYSGLQTRLFCLGSNGLEIFIQDEALKLNHIRLFVRPLLCLFARLRCSQEGGGTHLQRQWQSHKVGVPNEWWRVSIRANKSANITAETRATNL